MPAKPGGSGPTSTKDQKTTTSRIISTRVGTSKLQVDTNVAIAYSVGTLTLLPFQKAKYLTGLLKRYECLDAFQV
jgi:hypothetical protein